MTVRTSICPCAPGGVTVAAEGASAEGVEQDDVAQICVRSGLEMLLSPVGEVAAFAVKDRRRSSPVSLVLQKGTVYGGYLSELGGVRGCPSVEQGRGGS